MDGEISKVWKRGFLEERKVEFGWGEGRFGGETACAQARGDKRGCLWPDQKTGV